MKTVYLAAPLFSEAERDFNRKLGNVLIKALLRFFYRRKIRTIKG